MLAKHKVVGSTPITRSTSKPRLRRGFFYPASQKTTGLSPQSPNTLPTLEGRGPSRYERTSRLSLDLKFFLRCGDTLNFDPACLFFELCEVIGHLHTEPDLRA